MTNFPTRILQPDRDVDELASPSMARPVTHEEFPAADRFQPLKFVESNSEPSTANQSKRSASSIQSALTALYAAAELIRAERDGNIEHFQSETIKLAVAIARRLLRKSHETDMRAVIDSVSSLLTWSTGAERIRIRLHPSDWELVSAEHDSPIARSGEAIEFHADDRLSRGDCLIESSHGCIDGRIETVLDRIADELLDVL